MHRIYIATNNGDIGGGEVMLLQIAEALRQLDTDVTVIGPGEPSSLIDAARNAGHSVVSMQAGDRVAYMRALREWRRTHRDGILWCNGLVPAAATAGMGDRVVHLHQIPAGLHRPLAAAARIGAKATVVPSATMARHVARSKVLHNWTGDVERVTVPRGMGPIRLGFLGRPSESKGIHVLADALDLLRREEPERYRLRIAGEPHFVDARERAFVEARIRSLGSNADRLGWMPADEFFGTIDLLVVPSIAPESFGLVAADAMAARVPVVVTNAGALPEVVGPGHPWVAQAGDSADLAHVIREAADALPAQKAVDRARERWQANFSPEAGRARLSDLLIELGLTAEMP